MWGGRGASKKWLDPKINELVSGWTTRRTYPILKHVVVVVVQPVGLQTIIRVQDMNEKDIATLTVDIARRRRLETTVEGERRKRQ